MQHLLSMRSSEDLYNRLDHYYTRDLIYLKYLIEANCKGQDYQVCKKWLKIFEKTAMNEKRQRNFLVDLMINQLQNSQKISLPFTNIKNCDENLVKVVQDLAINPQVTTSDPENIEALEITNSNYKDNVNILGEGSNLLENILTERTPEQEPHPAISVYINSGSKKRIVVSCLCEKHRQSSLEDKNVIPDKDCLEKKSSIIQTKANQKSMNTNKNSLEQKANLSHDNSSSMLPNKEPNSSTTLEEKLKMVNTKKNISKERLSPTNKQPSKNAVDQNVAKIHSVEFVPSFNNKLNKKNSPPVNKKPCEDNSPFSYTDPLSSNEKIKTDNQCPPPNNFDKDALCVSNDISSLGQKVLSETSMYVKSPEKIPSSTNATQSKVSNSDSSAFNNDLCEKKGSYEKNKALTSADSMYCHDISTEGNQKPEILETSVPTMDYSTNSQQVSSEMSYMTNKFWFDSDKFSSKDYSENVEDETENYSEIRSKVIDEIRNMEEVYKNKDRLLKNLPFYNDTMYREIQVLKKNLKHLVKENEELSADYEELKCRREVPGFFENIEPIRMEERFVKFISINICKFVEEVKSKDKTLQQGPLLNIFENVFGSFAKDDRSFQTQLQSLDKTFREVVKFRFDQEFEYRRNLLIDHNEVQFRKFKKKLNAQLDERISFSTWYRNLQLKFIKLKCFSFLRKVYIKMFSGESAILWKELCILEKKYQDILQDIFNNSL